MATKGKRCTETINETINEATIDNRKELMEVELEQSGELKKFSFPKQGLTIQAKNIEEANRKMKVIIEYRKKTI